MKTFLAAFLISLLATDARAARLPAPGWLVKSSPGAKSAYDALSARAAEQLLAFAKAGKPEQVGGEQFYKLVAERGDAAFVYVSENYEPLKDDSEALKALCAEPWLYFATPGPDGPSPPPKPMPPLVPPEAVWVGVGLGVGFLTGRWSRRARS